MKAAAPQLGATPAADTPRALAAAITKALGRTAGFGEVACAACGRDLARGLALCPYCGHDLGGAPVAGLAPPEGQLEPDRPTDPPAAAPLDSDATRRPKRRLLIKAALAGGLKVADFKGKTDAQLAALVAALGPK